MAFGRVLSLRLRATVIACALLAVVAAALPAASQARQDTRTLKLHFTHTGERGTFTYRRGGQYDRKELERINHILRDWRRNEPTRMDPALLDLLWDIHRRTGSNEYIHIISAYRSPTTNEALRKRSSGVAQNSQHTRGKAMDFFIPGVPLSKLRAIALTAQGGGVGYYPGSGSPFVHVDTGSVRHWPRMTRQQLASIFPNGETLHLPSDGKPLPGYERAVAKQKSGQSIAVASAAGPSSRDQANMSGWLKRVFSRGTEVDGGTARERPAAASQPTRVARAAEPRQPEPPRAVPAPRPEAVETTVAANEAETDVAESEAETVVAANIEEADSPPLPRAIPAKVRSLLVAARERAQLARMAAAATDPATAPATSPQARPEAPVAVAALGNRGGRAEVDSISTDDALAGLYAAASGGNPEPGAPRLITAAAVQPEPTGPPSNSDANPPRSGELAVALLGLTDMPGLSPLGGRGRAGTALEAANALGEAGDQTGDSVRRPPVELAYATTVAPVGGAPETPSRNPEPQAQRPAVTAVAPMPFVAVRLDRPLLQRLMSRETTRTETFGMLAGPQPGADLYFAPADGGSSVALAQLEQPRTDRFQRH